MIQATNQSLSIINHHQSSIIIMITPIPGQVEHRKMGEQQVCEETHVLETVRKSDEVPTDS